MKSDQDLDLAKRCAAGDEVAWGRFLRLYRGFMIAFAGRIVAGVAAADVADAVIADLWQRRAIARFEGRSSLRTWLGALVVNAALNSRRGAASHARASAAAPRATVEPAPARAQAAALVVAALSETIAALPPDDRLLVLMHYEQELSLAECAAVLGSSKATLSRRLNAICERVRSDADGLSRTRFRTPLTTLRSTAGDNTLELDLGAACRRLGNTAAPSVSKE